MTVIFGKAAYSLRPALRPTYYVYKRATQEYARAEEEEERGQEEEEEEESGWAALKEWEGYSILCLLTSQHRG